MLWVNSMSHYASEIKISGQSCQDIFCENPAFLQAGLSTGVDQLPLLPVGGQTHQPNS